MSLSLCAFILCFCRAFVRRERVLVLCCPTAEAYKDFSQQIRTSTACVPGQWMEQTGRDWLLIIALDVGGMWRERGWDNRRTDTQECLQRPVPDTHTHSLKHTFSEQVSCSPAHIQPILTPNVSNMAAQSGQWPHKSDAVVLASFLGSPL